MTTFEEKHRVTIFVEPEDYKILDRVRREEDLRFVPQVVLMLVKEYVKEIKK